MKLSAVLITKNESAMLARCLDSLKGVDDIVIVDTGSTDSTVAIAKKYTKHVFTTYTEITTAEIDAGTASTLRTMTGRRSAYMLGKVTPTSLGLGNVDNTSDATKNSATATLTNKNIDASQLVAASVTADKIATSTTTSFSFGSGWSSLAGHTVTATKVGAIVILSGIVTKSSSFSSTETMCNIPSGFRPAARNAATYGIYATPTTATSPSWSGSMNIWSKGTAQAGDITTRGTSSTAAFVSLYGVTYECE